MLTISTSKLHKARLIFVGILYSYGIHSGKIAQITYKKKDVIERLATEFNDKLNKSNDYRQLVTKADELLTKIAVGLKINCGLTISNETKQPKAQSSEDKPKQT